MIFYAIRYFVVQSSYTLFPLENLKPKDLFVYPLINRHDTVYYGKTYTARLLSSVEKETKYLMGYLLKSKDTHLISLGSDLFDEKDIPNWERLFFIIDTDNQLFICQFNTNIATPGNVKNVLHKIIDPFSLKYGFEVKLDFVVDEFKFWEIVNGSDGLYQIAFDLSAPNLFGGSKKANTWIAELKEKHNMTQVGIDIRNEKGELTYDNEELESYRDYADSGGGNWTLGVFKQGRKRRYVSADHIRKKEMEFESDDPKYFRDNQVLLKNFIIDIINSILNHEN